MAVSLANAARPSRLPYIVACWEKEFATSPPDSGYLATVDFVVQAGTSKLQSAKVRELEPVTEDGSPAKPSGHEAELRACLVAALNLSSLPATADSDGPGFSTPSNLAVTRFRIAFVDDSAKQRTAASATQAHVLVGPRADRCRGLYSHDPPRDASTLYAGPTSSACARRSPRCATRRRRPAPGSAANLEKAASRRAFPSLGK